MTNPKIYIISDFDGVVGSTTHPDEAVETYEKTVNKDNGAFVQVWQNNEQLSDDPIYDAITKLKDEQTEPHDETVHGKLQALHKQIDDARQLESDTDYTQITNRIKAEIVMSFMTTEPITRESVDISQRLYEKIRNEKKRRNLSDI